MLEAEGTRPPPPAERPPQEHMFSVQVSRDQEPQVTRLWPWARARERQSRGCGHEQRGPSLQDSRLPVLSEPQRRQASCWGAGVPPPTALLPCGAQPGELKAAGQSSPLL